jgi:tRNA U34 2-thiouridine synthase MnmA/TrmU
MKIELFIQNNQSVIIEGQFVTWYIDDELLGFGVIA